MCTWYAWDTNPGRLMRHKSLQHAFRNSGADVEGYLEQLVGPKLDLRKSFIIHL